jgi:chemotaxis protein MotB
MALGEAPIVVIKKIKKGGGDGHHGGAWKVAYADFVTAMMAFFLLLWLINTTSPEQKKGIADYFAPASISETTSGAGGILHGTNLGQDGSKAAGSESIIEQTAPQAPKTQDTGSTNTSGQSNQSSAEQKDDAALQSAAESLKQALQNMPELAELSKQIIVDQTPEGLRIQLIDQEGRAMFKENSAQPNERAQVLLRAVSRVVSQLPNRISIAGHTSATPGGKNPADWQLSSARADMSRQIMQSAGIDADRVYQVSGKAASDPLYPDDPTLPGNRRITIVLLKEKPVLPNNANP